VNTVFAESGAVSADFSAVVQKPRLARFTSHYPHIVSTIAAVMALGNKWQAKKDAGKDMGT